MLEPFQSALHAPGVLAFCAGAIDACRKRSDLLARRYVRWVEHVVVRTGLLMVITDGMPVRVEIAALPTAPRSDRREGLDVRHAGPAELRGLPQRYAPPDPRSR